MKGWEYAGCRLWDPQSGALLDSLYLDDHLPPAPTPPEAFAAEEHPAIKDDEQGEKEGVGSQGEETEPAGEGNGRDGGVAEGSGRVEEGSGGEEESEEDGEEQVSQREPAVLSLAASTDG